MLDSALLSRAVTDAAEQGYNVVSFSGGEPLLYKPLRSLLEVARGCGLRTAVTTNGMLLDARRLAMLEGALDLLAISLDGVPASHNAMRAHPRAFETMATRLPGLRASGIPFGFIFTLTQHNLHELEWIAAFAADQGASLLQIHPLEAIGRATDTLDGVCPDGTENAIAFLEAARIRETFAGRLAIQIDLSHRPSLADDRARAYADPAAGPPAQLADAVSPLIIEPDATVVPLMFGFSRAFALGNLEERSLAEMARAWSRETLPAFRALCRRVVDSPASSENLGPESSLFFNWYEAMRDASQIPSPPAALLRSLGS